MKLEIFNKESNRLWNRLAAENQSELLQLELDLYKKLLVLFQIGDNCYFIFNFHSLEFDFISNDITMLLGYDPNEISTRFMLEIVHPDDREWFLACQDCTAEFILSLSISDKMKYKLRFDCRFRKSNGEYIRLMQQVVVVHTNNTGDIA